MRPIFENMPKVKRYRKEFHGFPKIAAMAPFLADQPKI
jgi:hypothetical protein